MTTSIKTQKPIAIIARAEFKANSYVLWGVRSGEKTYEVTCINHTVTGCRERSGDACKGYKFSGHCRHADLVQVLEWEHEVQGRKAEQERTMAAFSAEIKRERPIDERGSLNGSGTKAFSLLR